MDPIRYCPECVLLIRYPSSAEAYRAFAELMRRAGAGKRLGQGAGAQGQAASRDCPGRNLVFSSHGAQLLVDLRHDER